MEYTLTCFNRNNLNEFIDTVNKVLQHVFLIDYSLLIPNSEYQEFCHTCLLAELSKRFSYNDASMNYCLSKSPVEGVKAVCELKTDRFTFVVQLNEPSTDCGDQTLGLLALQTNGLKFSDFDELINLIEPHFV